MARRGEGGPLIRRTVGAAQLGDMPKGDELSLTEARSRAKAMLSDLKAGIDPREAARAASASQKAGGVGADGSDPKSFSGVAAAYFQDSSKRGGQRLRSRAELERKVKVDLAEWRDRPVAEITRAEIRALLRTKAVTSPVSANRLLALIRRILRWAVREEIIDANPATDIDPPAEERERERVLTLDEIARIWAGCSELGFPFGPLIRLLILTAQRRGEVGELRWSEIDGNVWRLPDSRAKRGKGHLIPLSPRALAILVDLPRVGDKPEFVFSTGRRRPTPTADPNEKRPPARVAGWSRAKTRLDKIIASAAAKGAKEPLELKRHLLPAWTLHDIRRSVATHLRDGDVMGDDRVERLIVSKILNHAEGGMTRLYDRYSADPEQRAALDAWARRIDALVGLNLPPPKRQEEV
jgi:integrase